VVITLKRAKGPLIFDLGICLVLISLPTLAPLVAIPMALGRRKILAAVPNVVCREPVRHRAAGAHRAGDGDEPVHLRLGPARVVIFACAGVGAVKCL
jgi:hypothetical protein